MKKYTIFILLIIGSFIFNFSTISAYKYKTSNNQLSTSKLSAKFQEPKAKSISLVSPNGAEVWKAGSTQIVKWSSSEINFVTLSYSTNNGISWTNIESNIEASLWQYQWKIPENITPSQEFRLRIFDDSDPAVFDISDSPFTLTKLKILSPVTGVSFQTSRIDTIKWFASADINQINIEISLNNGVWQTLVTNYDASLGKFEYTVPDNPSSFNRIRITNSTLPIINSTSDIFRIAKLVLSSPNGGEDWFNNSTHSILWNSSSITNLGLSYSTDNGITWLVIANPISAALNSYSWQIPATASSQVLIKVFDADETSIYDISNTIFTISTLSITSPTAITGWTVGSSQNITWNSNLSGNVKIDITTNNGTSWTQIVTGIPATQGAYNYTVPNTPSNRVKIRISSLTTPAFTALSDGLFTIGNIDFVRPAGGEVFRAGDVEQILWTSTNGINLVKIEYSTDGISWNLITANAQANLGRYDWAIPSNLASANSFIRLSDGESNSGLEFISSAFSITNIIITSPTGNEIYKGGTSQNITWIASPNISNVKIEFRRDDVSAWQTIVNTVAANLGTYLWNIPDTLSTIYGKIRISSTSNSLINTISEGYFKVGNITVTLPNGGEKLVGNGYYNIRWTNTNSINFVRVQYSLDGGVTFINIPNASNYPANLGVLTWLVPNILTNTAVIRISDAEGPVISDVSDANFSIAQLSLTYPNGGQGFIPGTPINITWNSTNISNISLDYSINNSGVWTNIVSNINAALGTYNWVVPNAPSAQVQIRISAIENSSLFDINDVYFKIGSIEVLSPNGNEVYQVETNKTILWNTSPGINLVDIDLTTNNGVTWITLASDYPANGSYNWNVTNAGSANSKIRISDSENPSILDISDNSFSIKNITVTYPNGGNFFLVDSTINITWLPSNVANVKIEYSTDSGLFWNTIINSIPAIPSLYSWQVVNKPSDRVLIRVSDADFQSDNIFDVSNANFGINLLYVLSPDGGENFVVNSNQNVRWTAHNTVNNIRLEYTTNNGTSWSVVENSLVAATQAYVWNIPNTPTSQGRIRIIDLDNSSVSDRSNGLFAIGSLLLTSPNGFERWQVGSTHTITWNNISTVNNLDLEYTTDNGVSWLTIANNINAALETYNWVIPNTVSASVKVRIKSSINPLLFDESDNAFNVCSINVTLPNGGEVYQVNKNLAITWAANNVSFINLDFSPDNGTTWIAIDNNLNAATGIYNWLIPDMPTQAGLIRVMDSQDNSIFDISNVVFKVLRLELISPDGGESYKIGMTKNITWNASGINSLNILYSINNGLTWQSIIDNIPAVAGSYNWIIPNLPTNNYKIKLIDSNNLTVTDSSTNVFTIGSLAITEPISGEVLQSNSVKPIRWNVTAGISAVKIEFRLNNSSTWEILEPAANAQQGFYNWLVPNSSSNQAKVRVSDAVNNTFIIDSSAQFTINTLNLTYPDGGQYWQAGTVKNILWNSSITGNLKIEYSINNGSTWNIVAASVAANTNSYSWNVPAALSTKQALIKITDLNTPAITDSSTSVFLIGSVGIVNPVGGELWQTGTTKIINFTNSSSIDEVRIEYTLDNINWNTLVSNYPVATGAYTWNLGSLNSSNTARIRISNAASNLDIFSVSNTFNIVQLDISAPNGGELWQTETIQSIKWLTSNHIPTVNISYSSNNGTNWTSIANNYVCVANDTNRYTWTIPAGLLSSNMLIKIESSTDNSFSGISANTFTIGSLSITAPTTIDKLQSGRQKVITWNSENIGNVKIDYSLDNGLTWNTIINSVAANLHLYNWTLPDNISSNQARIKISSLNNSGVQSISDPFIITLLNVISPNGGELWQAGSNRLIRWNSDQINSLSIYSSENNGLNWTLIASNIPAVNAQYNWLIPTNSATNNAKILLVDESKISIRDSSSTVFTINSLNLTSPIGGEVWQSGTIKKINWIGLNLGPVRLEYSLDNGVNWTNIISNISGSLGTYNWTVPVDTASNQVRIRISEISDPTNLDISEIFTINRLQVLVPNGGENWQSGSTKQISWYGKYVNNISLAYSIDNGLNWINIADNVAANSYKINWNVPANTSTSNALIKIWDTADPTYKDSSDLRFTISNIGITAPANNAQLQAGTSTTITWNASNLGMIDILYSLDNGGTWNNIATNISSLPGSYIWNIPVAATSNLALVRLQSTTDPIINITSSNFKISSIEILLPNGAENWQSGSTKQITWQSSFVNNINLYYSLNNGTNWNIIVSNIPAGLNSYTWTIPSNLSSSSSLIKITDANNQSIKDSSNSTFILSTLEIITPTAGTEWQAAKLYNITWSSSNLGAINIEYSLDNGTSWVAVANNIASSQNSYPWTVPSVIASNQALIRLTSVDFPAISSLSSTFTISSLSVTSPNGNERWQSGTTQNITWQSQFINAVNLYYSLNQGNTYTLIASNIQAALGTYAWAIPANMASSNSVIKIVNSNNAAISDSSDNNFAIGTLGLTSPLGGEEWQAGKQYPITWNANSANSALKIEYSRDGGTSWELVQNNVPTVSNSYLWTIPASEATTTARIRISDVTTKLIYQSGNFTIKQLVLNNPNGGQIWNSGTAHNIDWSSSQISNIKIEYSTNDGTNWVSLINSVPAAAGSYTWNIPADLSSSLMKIRLSDANNNLIDDYSTSSFIIGSLSVVSPNGGEVLQAGTLYDVKWVNSSNIQNVKIEYSGDNGVTWDLITNSTPADGLYSWSVPENIFTSAGIIKITDINSNNLIFDNSNAVFSINNLQLVSPNGFDNFQVGTTQNITWTASNNITNVSLEYFTETKGWKLIAANIAANLGTYSWVIPNDPSDSVRVRIKNSAYNQVYDVSNNAFRIGNITVLSPNTLVRWQSGTVQNIQWNNTPNVKYLNIDYSIDGGLNWKSIITDLNSSSGNYKWIIPNDSTFTAKIRIVDASSSGIISDQSDVNFIINTLNIIQPTGGENWLSGSTQLIKWNSTSDIDSVSISVSIDGGNIWSELTKIKANKETYSWNIPTLMNSGNAFLMIKDTKFGAIRDTSDRFSLIPASLDLTYPNGGEYLQAGSNDYIKWQSSADVKNIKIEFRQKADTSWTVLTNSYPADSSQYLWTIPSDISTNTAKIRITDVLQPFIVDSSDNFFKIGWVLVQSPNGGEHIQSGKKIDINWITSANISNIKIEYTINGIVWTTIVPSMAANIGTYKWTIPNTPSTFARIKISDALSNNTIKDLSDNDFTISLLQLTTPASSIQLQAGTNYKIKWNSSPEINYVNIEYTLDGTVWNIISQDSIQASVGEYMWQIPDNLCSTQGKIRIWDNSSPEINDTSKYLITFKMLNLTSPIGGENWQVGTTKAIRWNACQVDTITIEYSINNGQNWLLISENIPTAGNIYNWTIPNTISSNVLVRLVDKTNPQLLAVSNRFSIFNPSINLVTPNGGETWQSGTTKNIVWQSNLIDFVKIEFSSDSGATWSTLRSSISADSSFSWFIPNNLETRGAVIKVSDVVNPHIKDTSEVFTITELRLTSPMGGEYWQSGTQKNITWHSGNGINLVRLQYSLDNGLNWTNIAEAQNIIASVDTFKWNIPITLGTNIAKIRVMDIVDQTINSTSVDTFTIGWVRVITPNGENVFQSGHSVNVTWECSSNLRKVNVEIYNPSTNQVVVETEANASLKTINLVTPSNYFSDSLIVRISEVNSNYLISDVSDNFFSSKALELMRPVFGDNWKAGTLETIKWEASSNNIGVNIQYTSNNGVTWNPIVSNYSAVLGEYDWQIPNNLSSDKCIIKIYNSVYTNVKDSSGLFNIYVPGLSLISPNGNNYYQAGNTYKIQWASSFVTAAAIEFSSDNGVTWDTLKAPIQASLGEWDWQIPNRVSTNKGLIRISDYSNNVVKDVSDANFVVGWIDVVSPDGGENWLSNSSKEIRWENSSSISLVNIYYSNGDNGIDTNWVLLANNYPTANMPYIWQQIPNKETNRGKIKITDAKSNNKIINESNDYFSITKLYVLSPNGGEVWYSGNTYKITWTPSININGLKIELSTNGGRTWGVNITSSTTASTGFYNWAVDGTLFSDSALIRLTDVEHNEIIDISDGLFTLGAIQLRTFDNEEKVLEGSTKLITWLNSANIKFVDLLYRTKDKVWKPIKFRIPANDGQYNWIIPSEPSDSCYITIRNSDNFIFNDTSNKPFVICRMKFGSPNGGEIWQTGTTKEITWQSINVTQVYLEYSVDTTLIPITWTKIVNQPILASLGKYSWEIPDDINLAGKNYRFRIYDINEGKVADTSNSFSTLSFLRLLTPNNGEQTGTTQIIKWSNNLKTISKVNIYVQREISDFNWTLIARNVNSDPSSYLWNINIEPSQTCRIKVEDSQNNNIFDVSDIPFTVCSIKLVAPNGGKYQKLQIGKTYDITWETSFINIVRLEFSTNNGQSWNLVPNANSVPASEKRFAWFIDDIPSRNTRLRISDANKESIYDVSDTTFTICSLSLLQPNTLTAYQVGETYDITWQSVNIDSVRIQLSIDDGKNWSNLVGISDADSARFRWKVPNLLSALARIRISDFYEIGVNDTSNSNFVIGKFPNVVLNKPYQSNVIKFIYDFLTPQETIIIERFEYQIGEGAIINTLQSLIDPPVNITGPQTDTLYWRSTDNLLNYEGIVKVWVTFRSPQYNVTYKVLVDSVGVDNKAPSFTQSKVTLYQKPDKFGWNKVIAKWEKGADLSNDIRYKLSFNDINNEYINYIKETKEDSLIIPNVWSSVNYLIKLDVSDVYNNTASYILPNYKSVATCDFSGDNELNSLDLAAYIKSWSSKDSTIGADLAPYDGAYPIIKVRGDNKLNIEDLLVFVNMWNYGQEYTLPKINAINYYDKSVEREQITFKRGENNFSFFNIINIFIINVIK